MSEVPEDLKYTKEHEWIRIDEELARVGITDFAQDELGDVIYVELPAPGEPMVARESFGTIESVKAASDLYAPLTGEVVEVNEALEDEPELVNSEPYGKGWLLTVRIQDPEELPKLLDAAAYREMLEEEED